MAEFFWTKQFDNKWYLTLTINLGVSQTDVIEWMRTDKNEDIYGRTLTVEADLPAFFNSFKVKSEEEFEDLMDKKDEMEILDLDHILRHCERHSLKYKIEGPTLGTARRKYFENQKEIQSIKLSIAWDMCNEAVKFLYGTDGRDVNEKFGLGLLENAALAGIYGAYGIMAQYFLSKNMTEETADAAKKGIVNGDPHSMFIASKLYRQGINVENPADNSTTEPDNEKAVEWCLKAARSGWNNAIRELNRYIHCGLLVPDTKLYLELLVIQAKYNSFRRGTTADHNNDQ